MKKMHLLIACLIVVACASLSNAGTMTDSRDGQKYKTVKIGDQVWMAENLNYETDDSFCYDGKAANCKKYGRLYSADDAKEACPNGWHLPSRGELEDLGEYVEMKKYGGKKLKSKKGWSRGGDDSYGFNLLPAGYHFSNSERSNGMGKFAILWSSSDYISNYEASLLLSGDVDSYMRHAMSSGSKSSSYALEISESKASISSKKGSLASSVRCLQDYEEDDEEEEEEISAVSDFCHSLDVNSRGFLSCEGNEKNKSMMQQILKKNKAEETVQLPSSKHPDSITYKYEMSDNSGASDWFGEDSKGNWYYYIARWSDPFYKYALYKIPSIEMSYNELLTITQDKKNLVAMYIPDMDIDTTYANGEPWRWDSFTNDTARTMLRRIKSKNYMESCIEDYVDDDVDFDELNDKDFLALWKNVASKENLPDECVEGNGALSREKTDVKVQTKTFKDSRDGKIYKTVKIGDQVWMAENLNYKTKDSYCYDNKPANCKKYGRLYEWDAAMEACPSGWHLPSREEFEELLIYVDPDYDEEDGSEMAGRMLKSKSSWPSNVDNSDTYGFSVVAAGRYRLETFDKLGEFAFFWMSNDEGYDNAEAYRLIIRNDSDHLSIAALQYGFGFSIRCLQN